MTCPESQRAQAYFDDEVDALAAAGIETHIEGCAECRALLDDFGQMRSALRRELSLVQAPAALRTTLAGILDREAAPRAKVPAAMRRPGSFWAGVFSGIGAAAAASALFFVLLTPTGDPLLDDLVSAHLRSLMPAHLIDVVSTDRHTVKPWFAGHADVSPLVADFEPQGYRLIGGRADYFDHQRAAVVVYQHGAHIINVFSWRGDARHLPASTDRNGFHLIFWQSGDLLYCAVSDAARGEVLGLTRLLREAGARDSHIDRDDLGSGAARDSRGDAQ